LRFGFFADALSRLILRKLCDTRGMATGAGGRNGPILGAGSVLRLIRDGDAVTRAALARRTGLARSTVAQRVDALLALRLVYEAGGEASTGGRPATVLAFNHHAGVVLVADLGATHSRLAISDLAATPLAEVAFDMDIADGPEHVLGEVCERFEALLVQSGRTADEVRGVGVGVPGPVDFPAGRPVNPPIMPGWDGFSIPEWFAGRYDAPVLVDNDVNIMALGEHWSHWRHVDHLLYVKVGTGIGSGIVSGRGIHRGADGAAGDIGHIRVTDHDDAVCRCGNLGCLEAVAGGRALALRLTAGGIDAAGSREVVELVRAGRPEAILMVREAGRELGDVLAGCVNFFNPGAIVVGGDIAEAQDHLLAGIREVVFQRSLPLATRDLTIANSRLGDRAGVVGAAIMVIDHVLAPDAVDRAVQRDGAAA
jgi:predicted NBD/HSP70 family sugar kinase